MLRAELAGIPGLDLSPMCFTMDEKLVPAPVNCLVINSTPAPASRPARRRRPRRGRSSILAVVEGDRVAIVMDVLEDPEVLLIAGRLRQIVKR